MMLQTAVERLYGHIDNLELYTGLQAEQIMLLTPGSRLVLPRSNASLSELITWF